MIRVTPAEEPPDFDCEDDRCKSTEPECLPLRSEGCSLIQPCCEPARCDGTSNTCCMFQNEYCDEDEDCCGWPSMICLGGKCTYNFEG